MLEAVFNGQCYRVADEYEVEGRGCVGVMLAPWGGGDPIPVEYGERGLFIDPTDEQWDAARTGEPIPVDPELAAELEGMVADWMERFAKYGGGPGMDGRW